MTAEVETNVPVPRARGPPRLERARVGDVASSNTPRVLAVVVLGAILGCSKVAPTNGAAARTTAVEGAADRCRELPLEPRGPWPGKKARATDCASPRNSDGTSKRLPSAPPSEKGRVVLFRYEDFGPQAMAGQLIGSQWWSWEAGGSFEPCDEFDVRVVAFDARAAQQAKQRYPTVRGESDYRLVERNEAIRFLDAQLAELATFPAGPDEYDFAPLRRELERTRATIVACLPQ